MFSKSEEVIFDELGNPITASSELGQEPLVSMAMRTPSETKQTNMRYAWLCLLSQF